MWIKMLTDQIKNNGIYLKGQNLDLPESIVEKFDEGSFEHTCAPWDKNVPPEQLRLRAAEASYKTIKGRANQLEQQINSTKMALSELEHKHNVTINDLDKATKELEQAKKAVKETADAKASEEEATQKAAEEEAARKAAVDAKAAEEPDLPEPPESVDIGEAQTSEEEKVDGPKKAKTQKQKSGPSKKR